MEPFKRRMAGGRLAIAFGAFIVMTGISVLVAMPLPDAELVSTTEDAPSRFLGSPALAREVLTPDPKGATSSAPRALAAAVSDIGTNDADPSIDSQSTTEDASPEVSTADESSAPDVPSNAVATTSPTTSSVVPTPTPTTPVSTPSTTTAPTTTTTSTTSTTSTAPRNGSVAGSTYIAPSAPTAVPVYDTAWQLFVRGTPAQADQYFSSLASHGFTGAWAGIIHTAPGTYVENYSGGGRIGDLANGRVELTDPYIAHVRQILDAADRHGMKLGLVVAWQNLYLPGGGADAGIANSDRVRGTITTSNAYAYGQHMVQAFGDHPAVSMWVFGGDAGSNNTEANKAVWREMASGVRDAGSLIEITYHTPTSEFDQMNYAGEWWLDFVAPETGHGQDAGETEAELREARAVYGIAVWAGEPRYFNINFDWVPPAFRNPGVNEVRSDAQAARNAGVAGYVYGDAGRWTWCAGYGDSTPCNANDIAASFGEGERAVIDVFRR